MTEIRTGGDILTDEDLQRVESIANTVFPNFSTDEPVLGRDNSVEVAPNFSGAIQDLRNTLAVVKDDSGVIGFSLAMPIGLMDPNRSAESAETAYIYYTAIHPSRQGEGVVGTLMKNLVEKLRAKGYSFIERDSLIKNGYADKVEKTYGNAIVKSSDHEHFPEYGPERFFRIQINKITPNG